MVQGKERPPQERETLMFPTTQEARAWTEHVGERAAAAEREGVRQDREVVAQAVAEELEKQGEAVGGALSRPWEHTAAEHAEVQGLVDVAFARDLSVALMQARRSGHYPRNIDLFHDVLTTEMYELTRVHKLNRQPIRMGVLLMMGAIVLVGLVVVGLLLLF